MEHYYIKEIPQNWGSPEMLKTRHSFIDTLADPKFHSDCPICSIPTLECNRCGQEVPYTLVDQHNEKCSDDEL